MEAGGTMNQEDINRRNQEAKEEILKRTGLGGKKPIVDSSPIGEPDEEKPFSSDRNKIRESLETFREQSGEWESLNDCRQWYAEEYIGYKKEKHDAKGRVRKVGSSVKSFILPKEIDVDQVQEDESERAKKLKDRKNQYDFRRYNYADRLRTYLQESGFAEDEIDAVVKEEAIIDEYSRLGKARVEASSDEKEKGILKKTLEWYRKRPVLQKAAVSAVVGTGAFFVVGSVAPLIGIGGIAITPATLLIRGGARLATGIAVGSSAIVASVLGKLTDLIIKVNPAEGNIFTSQDDFIRATRQYEAGVSKRETTKRLATVGYAVMIGMTVGGLTSRALADNLNHVSTTGVGEGGVASAKKISSGGTSTSVETRAKPANFTPLSIKHTGWLDWVRDHTPFSKKPTIESQMKDLHINEKDMAVFAKVQDYHKKGYLSPKELQQLTESKTPLTSQQLDDIALFHPHSKDELLQALHEKFPGEESKWSTKDFSKIEFKSDGTILDKNTGEILQFDKGGKLLLTDAQGKSTTTNQLNQTFSQDQARALGREISSRAGRPATSDEYDSILRARQTGKLSSAKMQAIIDEMKKKTSLSEDDINKILNQADAPLPKKHLTELLIGKRGPEGAMIDWLKGHQTEADAIAKKLGISDSKDYGRIAHKSWLESMKDPQIKAKVGEMGLSHYDDTLRGDLAGMRHISQGGRVIIDSDTGKMSFSDNTVFLKPRITHSSVAHLVPSHPPTSEAVVHVPSTVSTQSVDVVSTHTSPAQSHIVETSVHEPTKSADLMRSVNISPEQYNTVKNDLVYSIVQKGTEAPQSVHGKTLAYLHTFLKDEHLLGYHRNKTLIELLEDLGDSSPNSFI